MHDPALEFDVIEELAWDPRLDAERITVLVENRDVTLIGTVSSLRQRRDAVAAARRVSGVRAVRDELVVRLPPNEQRNDDELRSDVLLALMLNTCVPSTVDAYARGGVVTLMGAVTWHFQRLETENVAANVSGVRDVVDLIRLHPRRPAEPGSVQQAARRTALPPSVQVLTEKGLVILTGSVATWAEHDQAISLAWSTPGTLAVEDYLTIGRHNT